MGTTTKTDKSTNAQKTVIKEIKTTTKVEKPETDYEDLKRKFEEQSKQIEILTQSLLQRPQENKSSEFEGLVHPNKKTKVTSLTAGLMTLYCKNHGFLRFENFGSQQIVAYQVLSEYVQSDRNFAENGYYYIHNQAMVEEMGLTEYYKKIFDNTIINRILTEDIENYIDLIQNTSENQKRSLVAIIVKEIKEDNLKDYNKIKRLSEILKVDFTQQVEEIKAYEQDFEEREKDKK